MPVSSETPARFFIVGAPKCGTTAWWSYLAKDPDVFLPGMKEVHHYTDDLLDDGHRMLDPAYYLSLFRSAKPDQLVGQAGALHMYSRNAASNIRLARPDAKIIAMLRNPIDLVHSLHSQLVYSGDEPLTDFRQALAAEDGRRDGTEPMPETSMKGVLLYRAVARLDEQLERYLTLFEPSQVHIVIFDDMKEDTLGTLNATRGFLGLRPLESLALSPVNANKEVRSRVLRDAVLYRPSPAIRRLTRLIPDEARWKMRQKLLRRNTKVVPRSPMPADVRVTLAQEFAPVTERLSELVGRDLRHWTALP